MPRINGPKMDLVQFRASGEQIDGLDELVARTGQSQSEHLRQALTWYLQDSRIRRLLSGGTARESAGRAELEILVVENQTLFRELLTVACEQAMPQARVTAVGSAAEAMSVCRGSPPDLMLLDLILSDGDGLDRLAEFLSLAPALKVIALSSHIDEFTMHRALKARVHGIVDKNEQPVRNLREAIAAVLAGRQYISTGVQKLRSQTQANPVSFDKVLSDREQEVLCLIGEGLTNEQIAERLALSVATARNHRLNIMANLDIHSAPQLLRYAIDKGFTHLREGPPPAAH
jgi:DNA-binding NarL/FixJ family response regulator